MDCVHRLIHKQLYRATQQNISVPSCPPKTKFLSTSARQRFQCTVTMGKFKTTALTYHITVKRSFKLRLMTVKQPYLFFPQCYGPVPLVLSISFIVLHSCVLLRLLGLMFFNFFFFLSFFFSYLSLSSHLFIPVFLNPATNFPFFLTIFSSSLYSVPSKDVLTSHLLTRTNLRSG